jgi:hypothetical protein
VRLFRRGITTGPNTQVAFLFIYLFINIQPKEKKKKNQRQQIFVKLREGTVRKVLGNLGDTKEIQGFEA